MKKRTNLLTLIALLVSGLFIQLQAQSVGEQRIDYLQNVLSDVEDPQERLDILTEIEDIRRRDISDKREEEAFQREQANIPRLEKELKIQSFENQLSYFRGVLSESDEMAIIAMEHKNVDQALYGFLQTDFMHKYRNLKIEAESLAATFKAQALQLPPKEVARVKVAYTRIADEFNRFLVQIKRDFMDRKKLKVIKSSKELYANSLQYQLRELQDSYSQDFERVVAEVTGSDMYAAIPLASILGLIKLAKDFTEYLVRAHYEARRVKEEHLNQFLLEPYSFRSWFEIEMLEGDIYNTFDDTKEMFSDQDDSWEGDMDPLVDDAPSLSRKKS